MLRLKMFAATTVLSLIVGAGWVAVRGQVMSDQSPIQKAERKVPPAEIKIPEARIDKVQLFQEQSERVRLEQQIAVERFKASPEWKALEERQKQVAERLVAELSSALRLAGVEEKDFDKYAYDPATLIFRRKEEPKK